MKSRTSKTSIIRIGAVLVALTSGVGLAYGWGGSSSGGSYSGSSSYGSWSGGGSSSTQTPKCVAANLVLSLTKADCLKCHPGGDPAQVTRHHLLIGKAPKNLNCLDCHRPVQNGTDIAFPVITDCIVCHKSSVHDAVVHCVVDTCRGCHSGSLPQIHAGGGSRSGSRSSYHSGSYGGSTQTSGVSSCNLCHASQNTRVQQTIVKGLAGQTISCSDCH